MTRAVYRLDSAGKRVYLGHVPDEYELRAGEHFYPLNDGEKMNKKVYCTYCKKELTDNDEILVLEFDFQYEENIFCSNECLIKTLEDWGDVEKTTVSEYLC